MSDRPEVTVVAIRDVARRAVTTLQSSGNAACADTLAGAVGCRGSDAECLLELRSALVVTRLGWEELEDRDLVAALRRALAAAKRLAIDM